MRDFSKVAPSFWTGRTGRMLRGNMEAQVVALYLMTCPHANMIGVFNCPTVYISHETGLTFEGASKGLQSLIEAGFCTYEADLELVWVHEMARFQIADSLKASDNRTIGVRKEYANIPKGLIQQGFHDRYHAAFNLDEDGEKPSPSKVPSKPLASQEIEKEIEKETYTASSGEEADPVTAGKAKSTAKTFKSWIDSLPADEFAISPEDPIYADTAKSGIRDEFVMLCWAEFKERHTTGERKSTRQKDWRATFRNAVRDNWYKFWAVNGAGECFLTSQGKFAARRHGLEGAA